MATIEIDSTETISPCMRVGDIVKVSSPPGEDGWNRFMLAKVGMEGIVTELKDENAKVRFSGTGKKTRKIINYGIRRDEYFAFPVSCLEVVGHVDAWSCPIFK